MSNLNLIDGIIREPVGGAHFDREATFETVRKTVIEELAAIKALSVEKMIETRIGKYENMGVYKE